jgi:serine/threonine-protein kinase RsbW
MCSIFRKPAELQGSAEQQPPHRGWHERSLSSTQEVAPAVLAILAAMVNQGYPEKEVFGTCLATEEAIVNALKHGNHNDPTKRVRVRYRVDAGRAFVQVADEGNGFDRERVPDPFAAENLQRPSGRGLLLMRSFMTWVRFNRRGNIVTLCKYRGFPPKGLLRRKGPEDQKVVRCE